MFDAATAAIIITAILGVAAPVTAAIVKLQHRPIPPPVQPTRTGRRSGRLNGLEARMATAEANIMNVTKTLGEFREEFHELRSTLLERWREKDKP